MPGLEPQLVLDGHGALHRALPLCLNPLVSDCLSLSPSLQVSLPFNTVVCSWISLCLCHFVQGVFLDASVMFILIYTSVRGCHFGYMLGVSVHVCMCQRVHVDIYV